MISSNNERWNTHDCCAFSADSNRVRYCDFQRCDYNETHRRGTNRDGGLDCFGNDDFGVDGGGKLAQRLEGFAMKRVILSEHKIPEVRVNHNAGQVLDPHTTVQVLLIHGEKTIRVRSSNGHTIHFDPASFVKFATIAAT